MEKVGHQACCGARTVVCQTLQGLVRMFHLTEAPLCDVHASYGGARDEHHTQRPLPDHRLVNSRVGQCLTYRQHAHQGGAANEGGITQAQQVAHIVVRQWHLSNRQLPVDRVQVSHRANARPLLSEGGQHRRLVRADGTDDTFTGYDDMLVRFAHFVLCSLTYSAMVRTLLKMALPSAGLANLMP